VQGANADFRAHLSTDKTSSSEFSMSANANVPFDSSQSWVASAADSVGTDTVNLRLAGTSNQWQQPLRQALGDVMQVQLGRGHEQAVIRLAPPLLGRIDISIHHKDGALQVHMSATNTEVALQLQSISESLRQDLLQRQYSDASVVVTNYGRQGHGDGRRKQYADQNDQQQPGRAMDVIGHGGKTFALLNES